MKKLVLFLSILLTTLSCTKDDASQNQDNIVLPKRIIYDYGDSVDYTDITISYDGNKIKETVDEKGRKSVYTYTGDLITNITRYNGTSIDIIEDYVYENDKIKNYLRVKYSANKTISYITKKAFTHNTNGTILEESYTVDPITKAETKNLGNVIYTFVNGNLTKTVTTSILTYYTGFNLTTTTYEFTSIYEYDDKKHPTATILGFNKVYFYENTKNNIIKTTSTYKTDGVVSTTPPTITNYTLSFNSNNHLIESKYNYTKTDNTIYTHSFKYFYE